MNASSEHFIAVCPRCLAGLRVNYEYSGKLVRCRHCDEAFRPFSPDFDSGSAEYAVGPVGAADEKQPDLIVFCPECATTLSVRARYAGRHVRCGGCRHKFRVDPGAAVPLDSAAEDFDSTDSREPTPDPDARRSELTRLTEEVAALRDANALLLHRFDELTRRAADLNARVQQLEAERESAEDLRRATLSFRSERSAANSR